MSGKSKQLPHTGNRANQPGKEFKRAYMACEPCRKTRAKCELGDGESGCVKCRRERRECVFSTERSTKKRRRTGVLAKETTRHLSPNEPVRRLSGKRSRLHDEFYDDGGDIEGHTSLQPLSDNVARSNSTSVPGSSSTQEAHARHVTPWYPRTSGSQALGDPSERDLEPPASSLDADVMQTVVSSSKDALGLLFKAAEHQDTEDADRHKDIAASLLDSPTSVLTSGAFPFPIQPSILSPVAMEVLELWDHSRFVRMGWFSSREAVTYIDLFFRNLSSLSPVSDSLASMHQDHNNLLLQEPLLCCTMLMISSRYHILPGVGGASRAHFIHARLWNHCEHLIARLTFGQEKYSVAKSRSLGTVKALLLIAEWHPRALHFPPESDGWESSLAPSIDDSSGNRNQGDSSNLRRWREEVFEPAKRSDRMSWMLFGLATTLAHELEVFDAAATADFESDGTVKMSEPSVSKLRVRRLLFFNVNQLALRLGCTSILPQSSCQAISFPKSMTEGPHFDARDTIVTLWIDITKLLETATEMFFSSRTATKKILKSMRYITLLEHFQPLLTQWHKTFSGFHSTTVPDASLKMLYMDYQYVRMYINSISIQALVERASSSSRGTSEMSFDYDVLRPESQLDHRFMQEVVDASRAILSTTVTLGERGVLRYAPVRLFLRVTSASMFLLKALSLGVRHSELQKSLGVLDRCIQALRDNVPDDIHLASRYAVLIERHVRRFRRNFRVRSALGLLTTVPPSPKASVPPAIDVVSAAMTSDTAPDGGGGDDGLENIGGTYIPLDTNVEMDDWLVQPFDPSIALGLNQPNSGLELDSLDFLWNMAT